MVGLSEVIPYNQPSPLYGQIQPYQPYNPFSGLGGGGLLGMGMQQLAGMMGDALGGTPMGFLGGNPYNNMNRVLFDQQHMIAVQKSLEQDLKSLSNNARGAFAMAGMQYSKEQEAAFLQGTRHLMQIGVKTAPQATADWLDFFTGGRAPSALATYVHMAGRNIRDPISGRMGLSGTASAELAGGLFSAFRFDDPTAWRGETRGLGTAQLGGMLQEYTRRGMIEVTGQNGQIDVGRVKGQLQEYTKAISAIREIFGDHGHPNAPMQDLIRGLETLTLGSNYQLSSGRTEMMVRNMYNAAQTAGVDMQGLGFLMQTSGAGAQALGLQAPWAMSATTQALNFQTGMASTGALQNPAWGLYSPERLVAMRQQLSLRNAASSFSNKLGAMQRIVDRYGVQGAAGDRVTSWLAAAAAGTTPSDLLEMDSGGLMSILQRATGRSMAQIESMFEQTTANEEASFRGGFSEALNNASRQELVNRVMGGSILNRADRGVRETIGRAAGGGRLAEGLSQAMRRSLLSKDITVLGDVRSMRQATADDLEKYLRAEAAKGNNAAKAMINNLSRSSIGLHGELQAMAEDMYKDAEAEAIRSNLLQPGESFINYLAIAGDPRISRGAKDARLGNELASMIGSATSGSMDSNYIRRLFQGLQEAGVDPSKANLGALAMAGLGIKDNKTLASELDSVLGELFRAESAFNQAQDAAFKLPAGAQRDAALKDIAAKKRALDDKIEKYTTFIESNEELQRAWQEKQAKDAAEGGEGASGNANSINMTNVTFNFKDTEVKAASGEGKANGGRGSAQGR